MGWGGVGWAGVGWGGVGCTLGVLAEVARPALDGGRAMVVSLWREHALIDNIAIIFVFLSG